MPITVVIVVVVVVVVVVVRDDVTTFPITEWPNIHVYFIFP